MGHATRKRRICGACKNGLRTWPNKFGTTTYWCDTCDSL